MTDSRFYTILQFIAPHGIAQSVNISALLAEMFPKLPEDTSLGVIQEHKQKAYDLVNNMLGAALIKCNMQQFNSIGKGNMSTPTVWFGEVGIHVSMDLEGAKYMADERNWELQKSLSESVILTNASLRAANDSNINLGNETKSYYNHLRNATWVIAAATVVTMITTFFNLKQCDRPVQSTPISNSKDSSRLQTLPLQGQKSTESSQTKEVNANLKDSTKKNDSVKTKPIGHISN